MPVLIYMSLIVSYHIFLYFIVGNTGILLVLALAISQSVCMKLSDDESLGLDLVLFLHFIQISCV